MHYLQESLTKMPPIYRTHLGHRLSDGKKNMISPRKSSNPSFLSRALLYREFLCLIRSLLYHRLYSCHDHV
jgi:hypothetical protein